jgi:hypothetical protein
MWLICRGLLGIRSMAGEIGIYESCGTNGSLALMGNFAGAGNNSKAVNRMRRDIARSRRERLIDPRKTHSIFSRGSCCSGDGYGRVCLGTREPIECDDVRDHQHGHVDDRDHVCSAELPCYFSKTEADGVIVVDDEVGCSHEIEGG